MRRLIPVYLKNSNFYTVKKGVPVAYRDILFDFRGAYCYIGKNREKDMKKSLKYIAIILAVILLDQLSKGALLYLITGRVPLIGAAWEIVPVPYLMTQVFDFFNIVFTWNPGASFSMLRGVGDAYPFIMVVLTGAIIGFIGYYLFARADKYERVPLALIMGGALGNLIDRIRFGAVVDFLDFHIGGWHWPAFNIADICICVGVALYILNWFLARRRCQKSVSAQGGK